MLRIVMENSHSWRLTKPLRLLLTLFRRDARNRINFSPHRCD